MNRRKFLRTAGAATALTLAGPSSKTAPAAAGQPLAAKLPRWRGFNLLEKFMVHRNEPFVESDFDWMTDWGFDFVRLPMDYRCWTDPNDPYKLNEKILKEIDQTVTWGELHGVHVSLNLHRAPGYTVAKPPEKLDLWTDEEAQKQFDFQWSEFARRYSGVPSARLSFDLVNEPAKIPAEAYAKVARRAVAAIRAVDPGRLVISDGLRWGREPVFELADLGIAQSTRGYDPMALSHYGASWVRSDDWPEPTWPLRQGDNLLDRDSLYRNHIEPWKKLEQKGVGVHVGEWGSYSKTPHQVALRWMRDFLTLWREAGWGWALWNLRGAFGILDSRRSDVAYEDFHGHQLDRKMLELLREF
jgi:endoglucanase